MSNDDRERVAQVLNTAMAEGRLTVNELEERLDFAERLLAQPKEAERAAGRLGGEA